MKLRYREDSLDLLLPSFRERVERVLRTLRVQKFTPVVFDTMRTPEEADANARRGKGIKDSMHMYGVAADIICNEHGWTCRMHGCKFFTKLGAAAKAHGCTWGGDFKSVDMPHIQGIPVKAQAAMRALGQGPEALDARDELCAQWLSVKPEPSL